MNDYGITPEQYHAGLAKLWSALDGEENGIDDVFTLCANKIRELNLDLGMTKIALEDKSNLLSSCEKALEERDAK